MLLCDLALFERDQGRNAANAETRRDRGLLIDTDLGDDEAPNSVMKRRCSVIVAEFSRSRI